MSTRASSRLRDAPVVKAELPYDSFADETNSPSHSARRSTRSRTTLSRQTIVKDEDGELDNATLVRLKREADEHRRDLLLAEETKKKQRTTPTVSARKRRTAVKEEEESTPGLVKKSKFATKEPIGWEVTLDRLREFRLMNEAPVDTMGCERLAETGDHIPPE
ncbi:hypothetical protein BG004_000405, partial [Podila humilis]